MPIATLSLITIFVVVLIFISWIILNFDNTSCCFFSLWKITFHFLLLFEFSCYMDFTCSTGYFSHRADHIVGWHNALHESRDNSSVRNWWIYMDNRWIYCGGQARQPSTSHVASQFIGLSTNLNVTCPPVELCRSGHMASKFIGTWPRGHIS
jgi:hypothetical protein